VKYIPLIGLMLLLWLGGLLFFSVILGGRGIYP